MTCPISQELPPLTFTDFKLTCFPRSSIITSALSLTSSSSTDYSIRLVFPDSSLFSMTLLCLLSLIEKRCFSLKVLPNAGMKEHVGEK